MGLLAFAFLVLKAFLGRKFAELFNMMAFAVTGQTLCSILADLSCRLNFFILLKICKLGWVELSALFILTTLIGKSRLADVSLSPELLSLRLAFRDCLWLWGDELCNWAVAVAMLVSTSVTIRTEALGFQMGTLLVFSSANNKLFLGR